MKDSMRVEINDDNIDVITSEGMGDLSRITISLDEDNENGKSEKIAAILLLNDQICIKDEIYSLDGNLYECKVSIFVMCNDVFDEGSDEEPVNVYELTDLFRMWMRDRVWGTTAWCVKKRGVMPLPVTKKAIEKSGWDLSKYVKG